MPLDRNAYPRKWRLDGVAPWPSWACKSPSGHIHKDNRVGAIDVHLSRLPKKADEISWPCEFQVRLIAKAWLGLFEDLIDTEKTGIGRVFLGGEEATEWVTLHEANPPLVMMKEGWRQHCPICGGDDNVIFKGKFSPTRRCSNAT